MASKRAVAARTATETAFDRARKGLFEEGHLQFADASRSRAPRSRGPDRSDLFRRAQYLHVRGCALSRGAAREGRSGRAVRRRICRRTAASVWLVNHVL